MVVDAAVFAARETVEAVSVGNVVEDLDVEVLVIPMVGAGILSEDWVNEYMALAHAPLGVWVLVSEFLISKHMDGAP